MPPSTATSVLLLHRFLKMYLILILSVLGRCVAAQHDLISSSQVSGTGTIVLYRTLFLDFKYPTRRHDENLHFVKNSK